MRRFFLFVGLLWSLVFWFCPAQSHAQSVSVRSGDHDGYSRLVLQVSGGATFTSNSIAADTLQITLQTEEAISQSAITARNIASIRQLSSDPLVVELKILPGARTRVFNIGNRIIADVYDVPGQSLLRDNLPGPEEEQTPLPRPSDTPPPAEVEPAPQEEQTIPDQDDTPTSIPEEPKTQTLLPAASGSVDLQAIPYAEGDVSNEVIREIVEDGIEAINDNAQIVIDGSLGARAPPSVDETQENTNPTRNSDVIQEGDLRGLVVEQDAESQSQTDDIAARVEKQFFADGQLPLTPKANLISLSSTESFGMAMYEEGDRMWMVVDRRDLFIDTKISGPQADFFLPMERSDLNGGVLYTTRTMDGAFLRAQGGGVLWKVVSSPSRYDSAYIDPERDFGRGNANDIKVVFPFKDASAVLDMPDPLTGAMLKVVTVENSEEYSGPLRDFIEFEALKSPVGLVIRPRVDDLEVKISDEGVEITRRGGLTLTPQKNLLVARTNYMQQLKRKKAEQLGDPALANQRRIFQFDLWEQGGTIRLNQNKNIILSTFKELTDSGQVEDLLNLAKMHLANGRAAEALGFLRFAFQELPSLESNPEFRALRGAANAYDFKKEAAYNDLIISELDEYEEIGLWRSFVIAALGDWEQAYDVMGDNFLPLYNYPPEVRNRLAANLAEIALRAGDLSRAEQLFTILEIDTEALSVANRSALIYLRGEAARQDGDLETTKLLWGRLSNGRDELYSTKAGLALTRLLNQEGDIDYPEAIDNLERLRFSWRGDELEAQVSYWLGQTYFEAGQFVKGLRIMREAITFSKGTLLAPRIASQMTRAFTELYTEEGRLESVNPLEAIALYDQFSELTPPGERGDSVVTRLAEHMVRSDLLDRAISLFQYQLDHRLDGQRAASVATRLAAIHIIAKQPDAALRVLQRADDLLDQLSLDADGDTSYEAQYIENSLLRARAFAERNNPQRALALLEDMPPSVDVNRLRATISWDANYWDDAALALRDVIFDENISLTRPLSSDHAALVLNRAVALNLAGDRIGLANIRERFMDAMSQTGRARLFEVVTRARQNAVLADRETLLSITSEVDLFSDFLESYREVKTN